MQQLLALVGLGVVATSATATTITFDNASDFPSKFTVNVQTGGGTGYTPATTGGVGNSGALQVTQDRSTVLDETAIYNAETYNLQAGTVSIGQMVHVAPVTQTGDRLLQLGLIDGTGADRRLNGGGTAHANFVSARYSPTAVTATGATTSPFTYTVQTGSSDGTTATATTTSANGPTVNLNVGDWYLFTINMNVTGTANTFEVDSTLQDFGTDGLTPGATITNAAQNIATTNAAFFSSTADYAALRAFRNAGGADVLDTFTVTGAATPAPEPASLGVLSVGAAALLARRRKAKA